MITQALLQALTYWLLTSSVMWVFPSVLWLNVSSAFASIAIGKFILVSHFLNVKALELDNVLFLDLFTFLFEFLPWEELCPLNDSFITLYPSSSLAIFLIFLTFSSLCAKYSSYPSFKATYKSVKLTNSSSFVKLNDLMLDFTQS